MNRGIQVTKASLRDDLRGSIEAVEAALRLQAPEPALECLNVQAYLSFACLSFPAGSARLRELLGKLRSLLDGRKRLPAGSAASLACAMVALGPDTVSFGTAAPWAGTMARVLESEEIPFLGDAPVSVQVRGADKDAAERKIAWLLGQLGVPQ